MISNLWLKSAIENWINDYILVQIQENWEQNLKQNYVIQEKVNSMYSTGLSSSSTGYIEKEYYKIFVKRKINILVIHHLMKSDICKVLKF
jgi:hypothetical protein